MVKFIFPLATVTLLSALSACAVEAPTSEPSSAAISALAGSEWGPKDQPNVFLAFKADGKVIGSGGCNNFFSTYTAIEYAETDISTLNFGPIGSTKKLCATDVMKVEAALFDALRQTDTGQIYHVVLMLRDKDGTPLMTLQRRDWD